MDQILSGLALFVGIVIIKPLMDRWTSREWWEERYARKERLRKAALLQALLSGRRE